MAEHDLFLETGGFEEREAVFGPEDDGKRLDAALAERFSDISRSRIQAILEEGGVSPCGLSKNTRVKAGDKVYIMVNERVPLSAVPEDIPIDIVYEDEDVIVVDKARGMVVHPAKGNPSGTLVNALLGRCRVGEGGVLDGLSSGMRSGSGVRPGIVHRIDKNTSGLLVVAKNDMAHEGLAAQFAAHTIMRKYRAIVLGGFREEAGTVDMPIGRGKGVPSRQAVVHEPGAGKRAVTHWRVLERMEGRHGVFTLLELALETGRTHQIRVHMSSIGHPVLGDDLYGARNGIAAKEGQYLHAGALGFEHPGTGAWMEFESALPRYFSEMLGAVRGK